MISEGKNLSPYMPDRNCYNHLLISSTVMLSWFVDSGVAIGALNGDVITEEEVEVRPEKVCASCLDEHVCLKRCRKYFTSDAWLAVEDVVGRLRDNPLWYCGRCSKPIYDEKESSIVCDCCLSWFHFTCVNMKRQPKSREWFCRSCYGQQ